MKIIVVCILLTILTSCGIPNYECKYSEDPQIIIACGEVKN